MVDDIVGGDGDPTPKEEPPRKPRAIRMGPLKQHDVARIEMPIILEGVIIPGPIAETLDLSPPLNTEGKIDEDGYEWLKWPLQSESWWFRPPEGEYWEAWIDEEKEDTDHEGPDEPGQKTKLRESVLHDWSEEEQLKVSRSSSAYIVSRAFSIRRRQHFIAVGSLSVFIGWALFSSFQASMKNDTLLGALIFSSVAVLLFPGLLYLPSFFISPLKPLGKYLPFLNRLRHPSITLTSLLLAISITSLLLTFFRLRANLDIYVDAMVFIPTLLAFFLCSTLFILTEHRHKGYLLYFRPIIYSFALLVLGAPIILHFLSQQLAIVLIITSTLVVFQSLPWRISFKRSLVMHRFHHWYTSNRRRKVTIRSFQEEILRSPVNKMVLFPVRDEDCIGGALIGAPKAIPKGGVRVSSAVHRISSKRESFILNAWSTVMKESSQSSIPEPLSDENLDSWCPLDPNRQTNLMQNEYRPFWRSIYMLACKGEIDDAIERLQEIGTTELGSSRVVSDRFRDLLVGLDDIAEEVVLGSGSNVQFFGLSINVASSIMIPGRFDIIRPQRNDELHGTAIFPLKMSSQNDIRANGFAPEFVDIKLLSFLKGQEEPLAGLRGDWALFEYDELLLKRSILDRRWSNIKPSGEPRRYSGS